ncbi:hypothetical protein [Neisseria iguanae]|uniref:Lipoprotein n=1 Tax=Neisseria iguanae TaxID=90242 RepID=A0A2P7TXR8_9NEIS|nr:hypothetical protein [Neisseria iguanae]PSJ79491.1 hypothetical protein C7N83_11920 [Neisseria iguanae]
MLSRFLPPFAFAAAMMLTACTEEAAKSYTDNEEFYTGFREGFIESSTRSCLDTAGGDTVKIKALCECASLKLADSITREEMKNAAIGTPLSNIEQRTQAAVNECRQTQPTQ